jgi:hypothetical protein
MWCFLRFPVPAVGASEVRSSRFPDGRECDRTNFERMLPNGRSMRVGWLSTSSVSRSVSCLMARGRPTTGMGRELHSSRADPKSSNLLSRRRSSHLSLPYSMMTATKQSSTRPPPIHCTRRPMGSFTRFGARHRSDRVGPTTVPTPVSGHSKAALRHPVFRFSSVGDGARALGSYGHRVSRHSRAIKFAAIRTAAWADDLTDLVCSRRSSTRT